MKALHGKQGAVKMIHRSVNLITGAIGIGKVIGTLEEGRFGSQSQQPLFNWLWQSPEVDPFEKTPQALRKLPLRLGLIEVPEVFRQSKAQVRFGTTPVSNFYHLVQEAQNPSNAGKEMFPRPAGRIPPVRGHRLGRIVWGMGHSFLLKHTISRTQPVMPRVMAQFIAEDTPQRGGDGHVDPLTVPSAVLFVGH